MAARRQSALGSVIALVAVVVIGWMAVRTMGARQRAAFEGAVDAGADGGDTAK